MATRKGLAPVTVLAKTPEGIPPLATNDAVTGGVRTVSIRQSTGVNPRLNLQAAAEKAAATTDPIAF